MSHFRKEILQQQDELRELRQQVARLEKIEADYVRLQEARSADSMKEKHPQATGEEKFRKIFEYSNDAIVVLEPLHDRIVDANPAACRMLQYSLAELMTVPISAIHPNEMKILARFAERVYADGYGWTSELSCLTKPGDTLAAEVSASVVEHGTDRYLIAFIRDVTHRKEMERALQEAQSHLEDRVRQRTAELAKANDIMQQEIADRQRAEHELRRFAAIIEHTKSGVASGSGDRFELVNPAFARMHGCRVEDLIGAPVWKVFAPEERQRMPERLEEAKRIGHLTYEANHIRKDGTTFPVLIQVTTVRERDEKPFRIATVIDITERKEAELALRESERKLRALVEAIPDAILGFKRDGTLVGFKAPKEFSLSIPAERFVGQRVDEFLEQPLASRVMQSIEDAFERQEVHTVEAQISIDEQTFDREARMVVSSEDEITCIIRDITERKRTEQTLRDSEKRFRLLFDGNPLPMWVYDRESLKFLAVNDAAIAHYEYSRDDFMSMTIKDIRPAQEVRQLVNKLTQRSVDSTVDVWKHITKSGLAIDVEVSTHDIDFDGRPARLVASKDVTERRRAEETRRRYAKRLEALQELDRAILAMQSPEEVADAALHYLSQLVPFWHGRVTTVDPETSRHSLIAWQVVREEPSRSAGLTGVEASPVPAELHAGEVLVTDDPNTTGMAFPAFRTLIGSGLTSALAVPLMMDERLVGTLDLAFDRIDSPSEDEIAIAQEVAASVAITVQQMRLREKIERHAAELECRVRERTEEIEAFSYSVSHDLRAPLRAIDGFSRIVLEEYGETLDAEGKRLLRVVRTNTERMGRLIDDLLVFSRLSRQDMRFCRVDMNGVCRAVIEELRHGNEDRKLEFRIDSLAPARGDPALIHQLLINLLSNALKFTRARNPAIISVSAKASRNEVLYEVTDNGVGFDMKYADKMFGVFQRLHAAEEFEGTGVGLAIVHRIVTRHGGTLAAEGKCGSGASIRFSLPAWGREP